MALTISKHNLKLYFASILIYGIGLLVTRTFPYYQKNLQPLTHNTLLILYIFYLIIGAIYYLFYNKSTTKETTTLKTTTNKSYLILTCVKRTLLHLKQHKTTTSLTLLPEEKTALLFMLVKLFFLPLLINFSYTHIQEIPQLLTNFTLFSFILTLLFAIDTFIFTLGYCTESTKLQNVCKSVEPTFFGWFVTLICYPPFNSIVGQYIPWGSNDYATFTNPLFSLLLHITVILLLIIYVSASLSLGFKASNLTNRGIVTKFPYNIIRHPAYASKLLIWWLTLLPAILPFTTKTLPFIAGMFFWTIIYLARAYTEERHLSTDPEYQEYKEKVKYLFLPKII